MRIGDVEIICKRAGNYLFYSSWGKIAFIDKYKMAKCKFFSSKIRDLLLTSYKV